MFYRINPSVEPTLREELHLSNLRSKIKNIILRPNNLIAVYALAHCANEYILLSKCFIEKTPMLSLHLDTSST
jgi:hypothetical protein